MIEPADVEQRLKRALPDARVKLRDLTGTRDHYEAIIVSERFAGKSLIEQHQLVYRALGDAMTGPIHALSLKTYTPDSWAKQQESL